MEPITLAHGGGGGGPLGNIVGIAPVLLAGILFLYLLLLLSADRRKIKHLEGVRDETPSAGRLIFSGEYKWSRLMLEADIDAHFQALEENQRGTPVGKP
jgi:hypothetical protein